MKLLILGAAGKTGRLIVDQALAAGHSVVAVVRTAGELPARDGLTVLAGSVEDAQFLASTARDIDAVVSALGHTSLARSTPLTSAVQTLTGVLPAGTKYISLTGFGVPDAQDPAGKLSGKLLTLVIKLVPGDMFADGLRHVQALRASQLNYTVLRAAVLTNGPARGYELGYFALTPRDTIARADVATAMLACLTDDTWSRQAPTIRSAS